MLSVYETFLLLSYWSLDDTLGPFSLSCIFCCFMYFLYKRIATTTAVATSKNAASTPHTSPTIESPSDCSDDWAVEVSETI